ncbi:multidrug efflux MFS transporter [Streptomyces kunmingensis]|uniref:Multidrug efflux MFS transporter n=1 Tax=Streptomyces kunmingensis TaxID=68225 RepID=A0ABU6CKU0_9ACTN|nr:MDR family MFS transporter [Streptomyces kunmingensis]MEB3964821.1 multidrug efflux MFS transporter [Streptomyces kunmingensis]
MTNPLEDKLDPALRRTIGVILIGGIMGILDSSMTAVAVDTLSTEFDASISTTGWVSTGYLLALTVTIPVTAWAVDKVGGKKLWLSGLVLFMVGSVASGLAWNIGSLIAFRVLQGFGAGLLDPLMLTLLARAAGPARIGRVMGVMGIVSSTGPVLGPIVGGVILQGLDWRWMFFVNVPIVIVAFLLARRDLPADAPGEQASVGKLDVVGVALIGPGVAVGVLAMSEVALRGTFTTWQVLLPLAAAVVLLAGYAVHALRERETPPLIDLRLFKRGSFTASVVAAAILGIATFSSIFVIPLYYQQVRGMDVFEAGLRLAPFGVGSALVMPLAGRLSDRWGSRNLALTGAVIALLSSLAFSRFDAGTSQFWPLLAAFTLGIGTGSAGAPVIGSVYRTLPPALVPQGSSVLYMLNQLGASLGIALVALLMQNAGPDRPVDGFQHAYTAVIAALVVMIVAAFFIPGKATPPLTPPAGPDDAEAPPAAAQVGGEQPAR